MDATSLCTGGKEGIRAEKSVTNPLFRGGGFPMFVYMNGVNLIPPVSFELNLSYGMVAKGGVLTHRRTSEWKNGLRNKGVFQRVGSGMDHPPLGAV